LFEIGVIILAVGAIVALIGGYGEVSYIQCLPSGGSGCATDTQYHRFLGQFRDVVSRIEYRSRGGSYYDWWQHNELPCQVG